MGLDFRNKTLTTAMARDHIYKQLGMQKRQEEQMERMLQLSTDHKLRDGYFEQVSSEVNKFDSDKGAFYQHVNGKIQNIFEQSYLTRLDSVFQKCKEA